MKELVSLLYLILRWESMILEGGGLQLSKIAVVKENSKADSHEKRGYWFGSG